MITHVRNRSLPKLLDLFSGLSKITEYLKIIPNQTLKKGLLVKKIKQTKKTYG